MHLIHINDDVHINSIFLHLYNYLILSLFILIFYAFLTNNVLDVFFDISCFFWCLLLVIVIIFIIIVTIPDVEFYCISQCHISECVSDVICLQRFFQDLSELESKLRGLHDARRFLVTVCDDNVASTVTQRVHEIDERWQAVKRSLADQSTDQYDAGVQRISHWCKVVKTELSQHVVASYDDLTAQNNALTVSLVCLFSPFLKLRPYRRLKMCILFPHAVNCIRFCFWCCL